MAVCALSNAQGFLAVTNVPTTECAGYIVTTSQEYSHLMTYTQITALEVAGYFTLGFSLVFGVHLLTLSVRVGIKLINLI